MTEHNSLTAPNTLDGAVFASAFDELAAESQMHGALRGD
jgi:hypothetical protein